MGRLCHIWRNSLKVFMRYRVRENGPARTENVMPMATAVASTKAQKSHTDTQKGADRGRKWRNNGRVNNTNNTSAQCEIWGCFVLRISLLHQLGTSCDTTALRSIICLNVCACVSTRAFSWQGTHPVRKPAAGGQWCQRSVWWAMWSECREERWGRSAWKTAPAWEHLCRSTPPSGTQQ